MKTIHVTCTWRSTHEVEVPDDYPDRVGSTLDDEWADQDWE